MTSFTFQTDQPGRELVSSEGKVETGAKGSQGTTQKTPEVAQVIDGQSEQQVFLLGMKTDAKYVQDVELTGIDCLATECKGEEVSLMTPEILI